ncbi:GTPase domain-containing protein [Legionella rowbothamii]|uniref:GTPase domain-containing protein n=1 Tax=Legionella rowbothamii TaxID=96229 RepID=UPI0013EFBC22|nr:GTPase domain-containing protein [Legionella rowbothamii]
MSQFNVVFWSENSSGQSAVIQALGAKEFKPEHSPTIGVNYYSMEHNFSDEFHLWDIPASHDGALSYLYRAQVVVLCVDLSLPLNETEIAIRTRYIQRRLIDIPIVLVGTKIDMLSEDEKEQRLLEFDELDLLEELFIRKMITSAKDNNGIEELGIVVTEFAKKKQQSFWQRSSRVLFRDLNQLPEEKLTAIKSELDILERQFVPFDIHDDSVNSLQIKMNAIQNFNSRCEEILDGKYAQLKKALISFSAGLAVALLTAAVGFGIGFSLGFWSGPGALFTGAATAYLSLSATAGITTGAFTAYGLFKPSKEQVELENFSEQLIAPIQHLSNS